ncbi:hypothetical protein [Nonomuraea sp. NPDC049141]|uniref:hypothetical protein n=1 Tax=Nonomuraea sp. NPDC049141 TaxID=3155500 RepID=UPI0033CE4953
MTTPSADPPEPPPNIRLQGSAGEQSRLYQAARDQTVNQTVNQVPSRTRGGRCLRPAPSRLPSGWPGCRAVRPRPSSAAIRH